MSDFDYIGLNFNVRQPQQPKQPSNPAIPEIPANSRVYKLLDRICEEQGIPSPSELPRMIQEQHQGAIAVGQAFPQLAQLDVQLTQLEENENLLNSLQDWQVKIGKRLNQKRGRIQRKKLINTVLTSPYFWGAVVMLTIGGIGYAIGSSGIESKPARGAGVSTEQPVQTDRN